ncbi:MAG TPA: hypothetical protein ENJ09_02545 [Planctomycetes bacterium]|nr:hypothetical protein [Planctomycetota bacterium]
MALSFLAGGCGPRKEASTTASFIDSDTGTGVTLAGQGITIEFGPEVSYRSRRISRTGEEDVHETTVNGLAFEFIDGEIRLGEARFDGLVPGNHVLIQKGGIWVDGDRRWDFPSRWTARPDRSLTVPAHGPGSLLGCAPLDWPGTRTSRTPTEAVWLDGRGHAMWPRAGKETPA